MPTLFRGARPSPRHKLASTAPHRIVGDTPPKFANVPAKLSMWLNDSEGDCVSAEEFFAKAATTTPEACATDAEVSAFVDPNGLANGADLTQVMDLVIKEGLVIGGEKYSDGGYTAVDWTTDAVLRNAIAQGPVKIGVAAGQLQNCGAGNANGWFLLGARQDQNIDHCVSLCGYGTVADCAAAVGVAVPSGVDGTQPAYLLFTWSTIGVIDRPSLLAICGEAWLRTPTTINVGPGPIPTPPPPQPTPSRRGLAIMARLNERLFAFDRETHSRTLDLAKQQLGLPLGAGLGEIVTAIVALYDSGLLTRLNEVLTAIEKELGITQ
jgi:hypothetical protein